MKPLRVFFGLSLFVQVFFFTLSQSQATTTTPTTPTIPDAKWAEVNSIIDEVKNQNSPQNLRLTGSFGLVQIQSNTPDSLKLGSGGSVVALGIGAVASVWDKLGVEARVIHGRNLIPNDGSPNTASASITWLDIGPRYTINLDSTKLDNYLAFKILYHQNDAAMKLTAVDVNSNADPMFMTHYMGVAGSIERSIPITRRLGVLASFDLLQILQASSPSQLAFSQTGYGFEVRGEVYYQMALENSRVRLGMSYWQQGNENEFDDTVKSRVHKSSYFQIARSVFLNLSLLF